MEWTLPGWRDIILLLVVLAAIYVVLMLFRLTRVGRSRRSQVEVRALAEDRIETVSPLRKRAEEPTIAATTAVSAYEEMGAAEPFAVPPAPTFEWDDVKEIFGENAETKPAPATLPLRGGFGQPLAEHLARSEVETEMQRMRDEMERMRVEMEELRAARRVSPQYAEAMELAQRGLSAQDMADRLGISLAEAELVHALSRGQQNFDEGDGHGAH